MLDRNHDSRHLPGANLCRWFAFLIVCIAHDALAATSIKELLNAGRVDDAVHAAEQRVAHSPKDAEAHNLICRAYFQIEQWDAGIDSCERAAGLDPHSSLYALWLGRIYGEKAGHSAFLTALSFAKKARASFERAVELDPGSVEARTDLGEFYAEAPGLIGGGKDKARKQADALMSLNPARGHWVLARIAEKDRDPALAEHEYRAAIQAHPGVRAWLDLANFFKYAQRYDEMEAALHNMESAPVDHPESIMHGGNLLLRAERDYPFAIRLLRQYLTAPVEEGPASEAHRLLGLIYEKQGNRRAAADEFRAALALAHSYTRAQEDLKRIGH